MVITKCKDVTTQGFCKNTLKKTLSSGKSLISTYSFFWGGRRKWVGAYLKLSGSRREVGWGGFGCLFKVGCLLTFSAFRMGAYSRWVLNRGWAPIRINMVCIP